MGAFCERRRVNVMTVMIAACILAAVGALRAPAGISGLSTIRPIVLPKGRGTQLPARATSSADQDADELALILRRLKVEFANSDSVYSPQPIAPDYARIKESLLSQLADGHWEDVRYRDRAPGGWNPTMHLNRLVQMARSYANPASPDYHSPQMLEGVERGLAYWYKMHPVSTNWWDNTIGQPLQLARILVPLEDVLPADILGEGLSRFSGPSEVDPRVRLRLGVSNPNGADLTWYAQQQLIRGVLTRSSADIAAASEWMQWEIRINGYEGIHRDYSFYSHGPELYNGGYGRDFVLDTSKYAAVLAGTRYAFSHEKLSLLADYLLEGTGHMIRGKLLDYSADGRTIVRRDASEGAVVYMAACDHLAALLPERAGELLALKKHIEGTGAPYSFLGNRYFFNSDFMTHQREGYYISVKMVSRRTTGVESMNGENLQGCFLPFGATWIVRRGDEYKDIFPVLDWGRLPGLTSVHMGLGCTHDVTQLETFVGGVSDGTYGAAAMDFDESHLFAPIHEEDVRAPVHPESKEVGRKAWFFFDGEMVAMGAGITSTRDEPMGTTLNQTLLHGPVLIDGHAAEPGESKVSQGSWVLHDEVGYTFLAPAAARVKVGPQTGDWKSIGSSNSNTPVTEQVFALWIDHGAHAQDAQYAYAVVPGTNAQHLSEWVARPPVRIISNTPSLQAVINDRLGVAEIVFHTAGSVVLGEGGAVNVDHPCLALLVKQGKSTQVSVSSPGGEYFTVHLTLAIRQKEKTLTFELPDGDRAGKSQVLEGPFRW